MSRPSPYIIQILRMRTLNKILMEPIKNTVLTYLRKRANEGQQLSVPALDRYLVYVKKEEVYVGGKLLAIIQELIEDGLIAKGTGSTIVLTEKGNNS
jgi:hypothetical protein